MVLARVANFFTTAVPGLNLVEDGRRGSSIPMAHAEELPRVEAAIVEEEVDGEEGRPPYLHVGALQLW